MDDHKTPYATNKVLFHPKIVEAFNQRRSHELNPVLVHLMPQNLCNQSCFFCSYRLEGGKNAQLFDDSKHIPWPKMEELIQDFLAMGVKAVEITGGGEPTIYPHIRELLGRLKGRGIDVAMVTNGVKLDDALVDALYHCQLQWARVSIDAGDAEMYAKQRRAPMVHWARAWQAVDRLVSRRRGQVIGVGYVVAEFNTDGVYDCCRMAKEHGADNVRVSVAFTPKGKDIMTKDQAASVRAQLAEAALLNDETFRVIDLFSERMGNLAAARQDYDYCGSKDLICVIEGECNVYTCCTLTGDPRGLIGNVRDRRFAHLWQESKEFRRTHSPRNICTCECLYERRNRLMLDLMNQPPHVNFI